MPSEVRFAEVRKLLERAGYAHVRTAGSHHLFERTGSPLLSIPVHRGKVKPFYAQKIKRIIAEIEAERKADASRDEPPQGQ